MIILPYVPYPPYLKIYIAGITAYGRVGESRLRLHLPGQDVVQVDTVVRGTVEPTGRVTHDGLGENDTLPGLAGTTDVPRLNGLDETGHVFSLS